MLLCHPEVTRIMPAFAVAPSYFLVTSDLIYNADMSHMIVLRSMGVKLTYMHKSYGQAIWYGRVIAFLAKINFLVPLTQMTQDWPVTP